MCNEVGSSAVFFGQGASLLLKIVALSDQSGPTLDFKYRDLKHNTYCCLRTIGHLWSIQSHNGVFRFDAAHSDPTVFTD